MGPGGGEGPLASLFSLHHSMHWSLHFSFQLTTPLTVGVGVVAVGPGVW